MTDSTYTSIGSYKIFYGLGGYNERNSTYRIQ